MLKQIEIGGALRPIAFGYGAKRRLDPIIKQMAQGMKALMPAEDFDLLVRNPTNFALMLSEDIEFQIQLLKVGLEEGQRIQEQKLATVVNLDETTICDWMTENPEAILEALKIYGDEQMTIAAKKAKEDPEKFKARMMGTTDTQEATNGTSLSASPSGGSE